MGATYVSNVDQYQNPIINSLLTANHEQNWCFEPGKRKYRTPPVEGGRRILIETGHECLKSQKQDSRTGCMVWTSLRVFVDSSLFVDCSPVSDFWCVTLFDWQCMSIPVVSSTRCVRPGVVCAQRHDCAVLACLWSLASIHKLKQVMWVMASSLSDDPHWNGS